MQKTQGGARQDLGSGSVGKLLFRLAVPAVTAQIVNVLYNMVDRVYIGHIPDVGALALTGVGVCFPAIMIISGFAALAGMGGAPRASIAMGRGEPDEAEQIMGNCATLLLGLSILLTGFFLIFGEQMLYIFGASSETIGYASDYLNIYVLGTVFVLFSIGLNAFVTAQGFSVISMFTVLIGAVCNIILDPIFIFGLNMGVRGAALATIISQAVSCVWVVCFLTGKRSKLRLRKRHFRPRAQVLLPCVALGLSPFFMQSSESIISACFNTSLLKYGGDLAVGAMTICSTIMQFSLLPLLGMTQGSQPIISYNFGARNPERVRGAFRALLRACLIYSCCLWAACMFAPQLLAGFFTSDEALIAVAIPALRRYMALSMLLSLLISCQQTFIALGNAKTSLFLAFLRKVLLLVPLIYILPNFMEDKVAAVFLAQPAADIIAVSTIAILFFFQFRKAMRELEPQAEGDSVPL